MSDTRRYSPTSDRLLLDVMLGKLAVYLRCCGYDTVYAGDRDIEADDRLRELAATEGRVLITRDTELAARVDRGLLLGTRDVEAQLSELHDMGVELTVDERPTHCGRCNGCLEPVGADEPTPAYAPDPAGTDCWRCRGCEQVFWKGSHWERMQETIANVG